MSVQREPFGSTRDGRPVDKFTLRRDAMEAEIITYGAALRALRVPDGGGGAVDVALGYDGLSAYEDNGGYVGAVVGRYANRIAAASCLIDGRRIALEPNEGPKQLHGGPAGFSRQIFRPLDAGEDFVTLACTAPDGQGGFPGTLELWVTYTLTGRGLRIRYEAVSDQTTHCNITSHAYFNLNGGGEVLDTLLKINAEGYTPVDGVLIPLGTVESVKGTPYDFTEPKRIGKDIGKVGAIGTYDINFALSGNPAAEAVSGDGKVKMTMQTDFCGVQLYVGRPSEYINGEGGYGFCLEPQYFPNAINQAGFEKPVLKAGEEAKHFIKYSFELI